MGQQSAPGRSTGCTTSKIERGLFVAVLLVVTLRIFLTKDLRAALVGTTGRSSTEHEHHAFKGLFRKPSTKAKSSRQGDPRPLKENPPKVKNAFPSVAPVKTKHYEPTREDIIKQIEKQMIKGLNKRPARKPIAKASSAGGWMGKGKHKKLTPEEEASSWDLLSGIKHLAKDTPLLMNQKQFQTPGKAQTLGNQLVYFGENKTESYMYPKGLIQMIPEEDSSWSFETCAIVGNSGVILLGTSGDEIDRHDAVFRINLAPVRGFEKWVGRKSTFNVVNAHNIKEMLLGDNKDHYVSAAGYPEHIVVFETAAEDLRRHHLLPLMREEESTILLNPIIANRFHTMWLQLRHLLEQEALRNFNRKPMSGFFTVMFALQVCEHVNLYGFDAYQGKRRSYRYHYFDSIDGFTGVHSFDLAFEVYKILSEQGLLAIQV